MQLSVIYWHKIYMIKDIFQGGRGFFSAFESTETRKV